MLSSYFDLRARRQQEERQEALRQEERRLDEERRRQDEERRRQDEERRRQDEERHREERRQDAESAERRHQELIAALISSLASGNNQGKSQDEFIRTLQQTIEDLRAENERLRQQNGNSPSTT